jgi:hypothetical protein
MKDQEFIDVELIIIEELLEKFTEEQIELIQTFDIITKCEYGNLSVIIYEDFSVCYPPEQYDVIVDMLKNVSDNQYSFKIFNDDENVIKECGKLVIDRDDVFIFNQQYN